MRRRTGTKRKLVDDGNTQIVHKNIEIQAIIVTDKGCLPPVLNEAWHCNIITALPLDHTTPSTKAPSPSTITPPCSETTTAPHVHNQFINIAAPRIFSDYFFSTEACNLLGYARPTSDE